MKVFGHKQSCHILACSESRCLKDPFSRAVAPSAPSLVKVVRVTRDSATLQWNAPVADGGAPITNYLIYKRVMPSETWEEVRVELSEGRNSPQHWPAHVVHKTR